MSNSRYRVRACINSSLNAIVKIIKIQRGTTKSDKFIILFYKKNWDRSWCVPVWHSNMSYVIEQKKHKRSSFYIFTSVCPIGNKMLSVHLSKRFPVFK